MFSAPSVFFVQWARRERKSSGSHFLNVAVLKQHRHLDPLQRRISFIRALVIGIQDPSEVKVSYAFIHAAASRTFSLLLNLTFILSLCDVPAFAI